MPLAPAPASPSDQHSYASRVTRHDSAGRHDESSMSREELAAAIYEVAHLTGTFTLRSGQTSSEYFDKFQFTSRPDLLDAVAEAMAVSVPPDVEVLAGLQLGGVPLAAALVLKTRLPAVYVRLQRKTYGTCKISEGVDIAGRVVAVVEDVITTGGQVILSTEELRAEGADVRYALVVVDKESGAAENLKDVGLTLRSLYTARELEHEKGVERRRPRNQTDLGRWPSHGGRT